MELVQRSHQRHLLPRCDRRQLPLMDNLKQPAAWPRRRSAGARDFVESPVRFLAFAAAVGHTFARAHLVFFGEYRAACGAVYAALYASKRFWMQYDPHRTETRNCAAGKHVPDGARPAVFRLVGAHETCRDDVSPRLELCDSNCAVDECIGFQIRINSLCDFAIDSIKIDHDFRQIH